MLRCQVRCHGRCHAERHAPSFRWGIGKKPHQRIPLEVGVGIAPLPRQPGAAFGVIDHHRPVINADDHVRNALGITRACRQTLDAPRQVVTEITDGATTERQFTGTPRRKSSWRAGSIHRDMGTQQFKRISARQFGALGMYFGQRAARHQPHVRLGGNNVVTRLPRMVQPAVQEHRPRAVGHGFEQRSAVGAVGNLGQ